MEVNNEQGEGAKVDKFKSISMLNSAAYSKPKKTDHGEQSIVTSQGDKKTKYFRTKTYDNGVVKNEICGLSKIIGGKETMIFGSKGE